MLSNSDNVVYKTKFKRWVVENRYTAKQLGSMIGCSPKSIYAYMQGARLPNRATMKKMEQALGIDTRDMFD